MDNLTSKDYWRLIILYGLNVATYKIALAKCLKVFVDESLEHVTMDRLSESFFDVYLERSENNMPQLVTPGRTTVMEQITTRYKTGAVTKDYALDYVKRNAFNDVLPAFQRFSSVQVPFEFYKYDKTGLYISEGTHLLLTNDNNNELMSEVDSRWDLLEASFLMNRTGFSLENDVRELFLQNGYERTDITKNIPVLNGYQKGKCFYCCEYLEGHTIHVDHVIPRQLVYHDEIWNLVLTHEYCNLRKSDAVPPRAYINKLIVRNEHFIASNHPIKNKLIQQLGKSSKHRKHYVESVYSDALSVIPRVWEGIPSYTGETDELYRALIRLTK